MEKEIVNRVASSGLEQIELDHFLPKQEVVAYDLANNLFEGLILREKDFRDFINQHNWQQYSGKVVAVYCSADAIVPAWAFMLLASSLQDQAADCVFGSPAEVREKMLIRAVRSIDAEEYRDKRLIVKGCSVADISPAVYVELTAKLQPVVKSLMFGEACSTVPVFKRKN